MFALIIGVTLGVFISALCTAGKITDLEVENYYLLRRLEEQENVRNVYNHAHSAIFNKHT